MSEEKNNQSTAPEQDLSELLQIRRDKLKTLQDEGRDPFQRTRFVRSAWSEEIKADFEGFNEKTVQVAGRIMSKRGMGKAIFCHIQDDKGQIQLYIRKDAVTEQEFMDFRKYDIGDIIGVPLWTLLFLHQVASVSSLPLLFSTQLSESLCVPDCGEHLGN